MESKTIGDVTISVFHDTRVKKRNGAYPVKYRVHYMQKQTYFPCMDLHVEEWTALHRRGKKNEAIERTRDLIQAGFKRITDNVEDLVRAEDFSIEGLNRRLSRGIKDSVLTAFDNRIDTLKKSGNIGSSIWYSCARENIDTYLNPWKPGYKKELKKAKDPTKIKKGPERDLTFAEVTPNWLEDYEDYLLSKKRSYTTISMYMRALRSIVNEALRDKIIIQAQYPFLLNKNGKYQIPTEAGRKIALTTDQLLKVFEYEILPEDEKYRDLWIFSFYCNGANMNDILRFKFKNIVGDNIEWYRGKTLNTDREKRKIRAYLRDEMKDIIERWGNPRKSENYIFPYLKDGLSPIEERKVIQDITHRVNKRMHRIGRALGLGDIGTYWARHTFASISREQGTPLFNISKSLGHTTLKTTDIYLDSLSDDEIKQTARRLPGRNNNGGK